MLSIVGTTYFSVKKQHFLRKIDKAVKLDIFYLKLYLQALKKRPLLYRGEGSIKQGLE